MAKTVGERLRAYILKPYPSKRLGGTLLERFPPEGESEYQTEGLTKRQWDYMIPENQGFFNQYGLDESNRYVVQRFVEALSRYKYGVRDPQVTPKLLSDETLEMIKHISGDEDEIEKRILLVQNMDGIVDAADTMAKVMGERKAYLLGRATIREWEGLMDPVHDAVIAEMLPLLRKQNLYNFKRPPSPEIQDALYEPDTYTELVVRVAAEITESCEKSRNAMEKLGLFPDEAKPLPVLDDNALLLRIKRVAEDATLLYCDLATREDFDPARDPNLYLPQVAEIKNRLIPLVGASMVKQIMGEIEKTVDQKVRLLKRTGGQNLDLGDLPPQRDL